MLRYFIIASYILTAIILGLSFGMVSYNCAFAKSFISVRKMLESQIEFCTSFIFSVVAIIVCVIFPEDEFKQNYGELVLVVAEVCLVALTLSYLSLILKDVVRTSPDFIQSFTIANGQVKNEGIHFERNYYAYLDENAIKNYKDVIEPKDILDEPDKLTERKLNVLKLMNLALTSIGIIIVYFVQCLMLNIYGQEPFPHHFEIWLKMFLLICICLDTFKWTELKLDSVRNK